MKAQEYHNVFEKEPTHFYYIGTHEAIISLIKSVLPLTKKSKFNILDAGCGTGLLGVKLQQFGDVWGIDISQKAIDYAKKRGLKVKKASVSKTPFNKDQFDLITSIDVLYHKDVPSDKRALEEMARVTTKNGYLILKLPAYNWLKRSHDKVVSTKRRYTTNEVKKLLTKSGYEIMKLTYTNSFLLPFAIAEKIFVKKPNSSSVFSLPQPLNTLFLNILRFENLLIKHINLPFGLSVLAVAKRR